MYCCVWNLIRHVLCLYVIMGFSQKSFDSILSISLFLRYLWNWCVWSTKAVGLCFLIIFEDVIF